MLREHLLFRGPIVDVTDVQCRVTSPHRSCEEHSPTHCIVLPRRGAYVRHIGKRQAVADPTHALFFNAGETYRVSHPVGLGDDCTALTFDETTLREVIEVVDPPVQRHAHTFPASPVMLSARTILLGDNLFRRCMAMADPALAIEETTLLLLQAVLTDAKEERTRQALEVTGSFRQSRDLLEAVRVVILSNPGQHHSLAQLAQAVGSSPFHLTRTCRKVSGIPLHQYVLRLRMAIALERIRGGATALSRLAFELGFSSHSHFTVTFRKTYGLTPTELRKS